MRISRVTALVGVLGIAGALWAAPAATAATRPKHVSDATVWWVHLDGGPNHITVKPGARINVEMSYAITPTGGDVDQIEIGYADGEPITCTYNGPGNVTGASSATIAAPSAAGTYAIAWDFAQDFGCLQTHAGWTNSPHPIPSTQYIGVVTVKGASS